MTPEECKIIAYAKSWGVPVINTGSRLANSNERFDDGPGTWGIVGWGTPSCRIVGRSSGRWNHLLHELAHAVCQIDPIDCDEVVDTMGFELISLRYLGLPCRNWDLFMDNVRVVVNSQTTRWAFIKDYQRAKFKDQAVLHAIREGQFTWSGQPTYRRVL